MKGVHSAASGSVPSQGEAISNARLVAELQSVALAIHMFGLDGLGNMSAERVKETPENEQDAA